MKKRLIFIIGTLLFSITQVWAASVVVSEAQFHARQFLFSHSRNQLKSPDAVPVSLLHVQGDKEAPVYYIFNSADAYVIIAGEDRATRVLAYGDSPISDMGSLPENMKYWLDCYERQIAFLYAHPDLTVGTPALGDTDRAAQSVNPLLTSNWSQNAPYWNECPIYGTDTCYTGCPATSLSMVFHYWKYPRQQTPAVPSYMTPTYGVVLQELPPTVFDWDHMLNEYTGGYTEVQAAAVAHLMRYIGQAEEMDYTISGSGAYGRDVLRAVKFFEYDQGAQLLFKTDDLGYANYTDAQWGNLIQTELTAGRPIVYCAYDNYTGAGHAFNVDGYDSTNDTYHVNWGWNGRGNGFFALNAFTYNDYTFGTGQQMVIGIQPPAGYQNPRLQAYPVTIDMQSYINRTATATISLKGTNLTGDVTLALNDPDGVFAIDAASVSQVVAEAGVDITVTYSPLVVGANTATVTCTSPDTDPVVVTLNGNAPFEAYPVEMQPANPARVTLTSFRADWTDATPSDNVTSYTLEVSPKPAYTLLVEADFSDLPSMIPTNQASHATDYLPEGWTFTGSEFNLEGGCIMPRRNSVITTDVLNFSGYDKVTVEVLGRSYGSWGEGSELTISSSMGSETITFPFSYTTCTVVLDCAEAEQISFKCGYYPMIRNIKIYAGDATQSTALRASETGDADYRLVEGITAKNYTVKDLTAGGTFLYRVKAMYSNGTESAWSNVELVTLVDNGHGHEVGDVNHDGNINITDVTILIAAVLNDNAGQICADCADYNGDSNINITDVTMLIAHVLNAAD